MGVKGHLYCFLHMIKVNRLNKFVSEPSNMLRSDSHIEKDLRGERGWTYTPVPIISVSVPLPLIHTHTPSLVYFATVFH